MTFRRLAVALLMLIAACAETVEPDNVSGPKRVALTFDDVPRERGAYLTDQERTDLLIAALEKAGVEQAAFFVNPGFLQKPGRADGVARIEQYVEAGHVIANHSFSHPPLRETAAEAYLADIDRAEAWLRPKEGYRPWFRYPFLDEGGRDHAKRDAVREGLRRRGLANGYVTIDASDWYMEQRTKEAAAEGVELDRQRVRAFYVEQHVAAAEFYDDLARRTFGRSPAHVMLLHETDLAALYVDDLVAALRDEGWEIITVDEAFSDPLRDVVVDVPFAQGTLTETAAWERDVAEPRWFMGNNTEALGAQWDERVLAD